MRIIGSRVGAIAGKNEDKVDFFGFGVYEGDFKIENDDVYMMGIQMSSLDVENPKIKLDNGDIVYGCECWWGPEDQIKQVLDGMEINNITVSDYRKRAKEVSKESTEESTED